MNDLISRKWLMECVNEGWIKFDTEKDKNKFIHLVRDTAPPAQPVAKDINVPVKDCISRRAAIDAICEDGTQLERQGQYTMTMAERKQRDADILDALPSAQPEIAENLYLYKCFITDKDGLQHEVIHTGDIRRVTGWEI